MATFATEIWTPGLSEKPRHPQQEQSQQQQQQQQQSQQQQQQRQTSSQQNSSQEQQQQQSATTSNHHAQKPPTTTARSVSASSISSSSASQSHHHHHNDKRPPIVPNLSKDGSRSELDIIPAIFPAPPKRNILYRIFHPGESSGDEERGPVFGRSRRSYGSGSEAESADEHSGTEDSDSEGGFFGRPRRRKNSLTEAMRLADVAEHSSGNGSNRRGGGSSSDRTSALGGANSGGGLGGGHSGNGVILVKNPAGSLISRGKPARGPSMFKGGQSDTEGSGSESEPELVRPAQPQRRATKSSLFYDLLHGGRSKPTPPPPPPPSTMAFASAPQSSSSGGPPSPSAAAHPSSPDYSSDEQSSGKSSDSDPDSATSSTASSSSHHKEASTHHQTSHNLFKDLIMSARHKKTTAAAAASRAAESHYSPHIPRDAVVTASTSTAAGPSSITPPNLTPNSSSTTSHSPDSEKPSMARSLSENSLSKYGQKQQILGRGANAVVRLCCPADNRATKLAIKEFRKRRKNETQKEYVKKLIAEFCISSTLHHENVVSTVDLIQDEKRHWCVVMEYCAGGDLFGRIHGGTLKNSSEVNCYFKQLVQGVEYLHSMGVAHRDLKPENLLLDRPGRILKITDFGVSEVFRTPFCTLTRKAKGLCGSGPYIAPEEFETREYDSELVDIWSIGIIYYVMIYNSIPWKAACTSDPRYKHYLDNLKKFWPLDKLPPGPRRVMYGLLEPNPTKRMNMKALLEDEWVKEVEVCSEKEGGQHHTHLCTAKGGVNGN
ncbi:kinase-like domain-containing protein [Phlyctochytrium arcticum]|nr:kinase-like domain-containing protein [Phlyctochytrium arcticum]